MPVLYREHVETRKESKLHCDCLHSRHSSTTYKFNDDGDVVSILHSHLSLLSSQPIHITQLRALTGSLAQRSNTYIQEYKNRAVVIAPRPSELDVKLKRSESDRDRIKDAWISMNEKHAKCD